MIKLLVLLLLKRRCLTSCLVWCAPCWLVVSPWQTGVLRGEVSVLPQREADVGRGPTLHRTGNYVLVCPDLMFSSACSTELFFTWDTCEKLLFETCFFLAAVPEADVRSGSGSGRVGKSVRTDPGSVWGSGGLLLRTIPGNVETDTPI